MMFGSGVGLRIDPERTAEILGRAVSARAACRGSDAGLEDLERVEAAHGTDPGIVEWLSSVCRC